MLPDHQQDSQRFSDEGFHGAEPQGGHSGCYYESSSGHPAPAA
jgi:hypothetical protein